MKKTFLVGLLLVVTTLPLIGCTKDKSESETEVVMEYGEKQQVTEKGFWNSLLGIENTTESFQIEEPTYDLDFSTDDIAFFQQFPEKVYNCQYETVETFIKSVFGEAQVKEVGDTMNERNRIVQKVQFDYPDGVSILGEKFYTVCVDYDMEDKTVYTVGFHKNTDINTSEGYTPSSLECSDSYENLYRQFKVKYKDADTVFTPDQYRYYGSLWKETNCGEIWISWGEKIFGSEQADCILSFSK